MVTFLTTLKTSKEWTRCIDSYDNLLIKKHKINKAMEESYWVQIYNKWHLTKHIYYSYISYTIYQDLAQ